MNIYEQALDEANHALDMALTEYIYLYREVIWNPAFTVDEIKNKTWTLLDYICELETKSEKREIVDISTLNAESIQEFDPGYKEIQSTQTEYDSEKKFATYKYIFQRKSDKKYFSLEYQDWGTGQDNFGEEPLRQVFLKDVDIKLKFY